MKNKKIPVGVLDFETDPFLHGRDPVPFAGEIYLGNNSDFNYAAWGQRCADKIGQYLSDMPKSKIYAHNGGRFDFHFLLKYAKRGAIKIIRNRIAILYIGKVSLIDSYLLMPFALEEYKKTKINYDLFERDEREKHKKEILSYLHDDCVNLFELLTGFQQFTGRALTIGSAAFADMRKKGIEIQRCDELHDDKFRKYFLEVGAKRV